MERWKDIPGFEGYYQISNYGRLKSFKQYSNGKILKLTNKNGDYFSIVLQAGGNVRSTRIHRLVAEAFISNGCNYPEVNHIDGDKQNNHFTNLEWCTRSQNIRHSLVLNPNQLNNLKQYNQCLRPKAIQMYDKQRSFVRLFKNGADASRETGICQRNILQVCNGDRNESGYLRKSAGGYLWRFEGEGVVV